MYLVNIPFLPQDVSIFKLVADGLIAFATLYGIFRVWPTFIKQKKVENLVANAKEASQEITYTEEALAKLFLMAKKIVKNSQAVSEDAQGAMEVEILTHMNALRNYILLLIKNSTLQKRDDIIVPLETTLKKLERILNSHYKNSLNIVILSDLIKEANLLSKHELSFQQLEDVRDALLKIHDLEEK